MKRLPMGIKPRAMAVATLLGTIAAAGIAFYGVRDVNEAGGAPFLTVVLEVVLPTALAVSFLWEAVAYWRHGRRAV